MGPVCFHHNSTLLHGYPKQENQYNTLAASYITRKHRHLSPIRMGNVYLSYTILATSEVTIILEIAVSNLYTFTMWVRWCVLSIVDLYLWMIKWFNLPWIFAWFQENNHYTRALDVKKNPPKGKGKVCTLTITITTEIYFDDVTCQFYK